MDPKLRDLIGSSLDAPEGESQAKPVYSAEGVLASVCSNVEPGDSIVLLETLLQANKPRWPQLGLVVRQDDSQKLTIIGFALVFAQFYECTGIRMSHRRDSQTGQDCCHRPDLPHPRQQPFPIELRLFITAEEVLTLACLNHKLDVRDSNSSDQYEAILATRLSANTEMSYAAYGWHELISGSVYGSGSKAVFEWRYAQAASP